MSSSGGPAAPGSTIQIGATVYTVISNSPVGPEVYATANGKNYTLVPSEASASGYSVQRDGEDMGSAASADYGGNSSSSSAAAPPSAAERFAAIQAAQITRNTAILEAVRQGILPDATPADIVPTNHAAQLTWIAQAQGKLSAFWGAAKTKFNNLVGVASPINVAHRGPLYKAIWGSTIYYTPSRTDEWLIRAASTDENPYGIVGESAGIAAAASKNAGRARVAALNPLLSALIVLERAGQLHSEASKSTASHPAGTVERLANELVISEHEFLRSLFAFLIGYNDAVNKKKRTGEEVSKIPSVLRAGNPAAFTSTLQRRPSINFSSTFAGTGAYKEVVSTPSFFRIILATANDCDITGSSAPIAALFTSFCSEGLPFSSVDRIPIIVDIDGARSALNKEMGDYQGRFTTGDLSAYKGLFQNISRNVRAVSREQTGPALSPVDDAAVNAHLELEVAGTLARLGDERNLGGRDGYADGGNSSASSASGYGGRGDRGDRGGRDGYADRGNRSASSASGYGGRGGARRTRSKNRKSQKKIRKVKVRKTRVQKKRTTRRR